MKKRIWHLAPADWWICFSLGLVTLAVFWPSLSHEFLGFDDQQYVTENPEVRAGLTRAGVLWAFKTFSASNWHPLTWLSHMLDCQLHGLKPMGHHLTNILLHAANTLVLFLVMKRMSGARWRSACVAGLFAWHPLHVESVAWIAERKDVLSTLFFLLTLLGYAKYAEAGAPALANLKASVQVEPKNGGQATPWYALSLLLFALALMSKPMVVTLPFALLLLDYWPLRRVESLGLRKLLLEKLPFLVLSAAGCALTVAAQRQAFTIVSVASLPLSQRLAHVLVAYVHYLGAAFVPVHLAAYYPYNRHIPGIEVAGAALLLALISGVAIRFARTRPFLLVGWLWYLGTLVPVIGLIQVGDQAWADRYTYIPLIGIFIMVVWGVAEVAEPYFGREDLGPPRPLPPGEGRVRGRRVVVALSALVGVALLIGTTLQLRHWQNTRTLFEHTLSVTDRNDRAATVLGSLAASDGRLDEASRLYSLSLIYNPDNPETHFHLGRLLDQEGKPAEALAEYRQALWARQWQEQAHLAMGIDLAKQKRFDEAVFHYQAVLALDPASAVAENNLARVLHTQGRTDEAIRHYEAAIRLSPQLAQAHNNLGVLLLQQGRLAEGAGQLREAARLNPRDGETQYNLALALNQLKQWSEAAEIYSKLAPALPNDPKLYCQYGLALQHLGKTREAMSRYAHALMLQPDFPEALDQLAWILATSPNPEFRNGAEAFNMALKACELTANKQPGPLITLAAAAAEAGHFEDAIHAAGAAKSLAGLKGQKEQVVKCDRMLEAFKSGKPWTEEVSSSAGPPSSR